MSTTSSLFRAEALTAANQPLEQLDQLVRLTSRRTWLTVGGALLLAVAALLWGVIGKTNVVATGTGVMLPPDGLSQVSSMAGGVLRDLLVKVGDQVTGGQQVAHVATGPDTTAEVVSFVTGTVTETLAEQGDLVSPGSVLLRITPTGMQLVAYTFMPVSKGQLIKVGKAINIAVDSAPSGQYGSIRGTVTAVSLIPASTQRLSFLAGASDSIVNILESQGPVVELQVKLERANTASGYRWTSGNGPRFAIAAGTLLQPSVVLSRHTLVSQLFS